MRHSRKIFVALSRPASLRSPCPRHRLFSSPEPPRRATGKHFGHLARPNSCFPSPSLKPTLTPTSQSPRPPHRRRRFARRPNPTAFVLDQHHPSCHLTRVALVPRPESTGFASLAALTPIAFVLDQNHPSCHLTRASLVRTPRIRRRRFARRTCSRASFLDSLHPSCHLARTCSFGRRILFSVGTFSDLMR